MESGGKKSRRTMIELDDFSDEILGSPKNLLGGAKSFSGGETIYGLLKGKTGIDWVEKIEKDEIQTPGGIDKKTKNLINTQ